jgi:hypothetical protein
MKLTIHVEGSKAEIAAELANISKDFGGVLVDTNTDARPPQRGRTAKPAPVDAEPAETNPEEFNIPEDEITDADASFDETTAPEVTEISDDDLRERGARFIQKKGPKGSEALKALLAKYKAKNLVAVPVDKREALLKALGA